MTYKPIPEPRRRELAKLLPELTRKFKSWQGSPASGEPERAFWERELPPGSPEELVWVIRHTRGAAGFMDPARKRWYDWPGCCVCAGYYAVCGRWPLEPIPGEPQIQPTPEGPLVDGTPVKEGDVLYYVGDYKPFIGAEIIAGKPKRTTRRPSVYNEGFYCLDGRWISGGNMDCEKLSRTKPAIIEGRVVKPGDVLYYKPSTPNPNVVGQERTVHKIVGMVLWFTNGATCGSPENMTYVTPSVEPARTVGKSPTLAAPFGASLTATQRMEAEKNRFLRACLDDADYQSRFMNRIPGVELEGAIHDELNFSVPRVVDLDFSHVEERIASQMEAYRLAFDRKPVKLEALNFDLETTRPGQIAFDPAVLSIFTKEKHTMNQAIFTKEKHTMNQATSAAQTTTFNHASLSVDTSNIVETKTFVFGRDIATLDDDALLNYVQSLTGAIEYLEQLNAKTPLAKLVTKIAQLKDAKAKIVDLLGGAPVPADSDGGTKGSPNVEAQPRKRRTKAEMEADAQQGGTTPQAPSKSIPPAPPAPTQPEPSVADVDLDD